MIDQMQFTTEHLANGIQVFHRESEREYTNIHLEVPVGTVNNTAGILPGTFHFLEHLCIERSQRHPAQAEFSRLIGLHGGYSNARTKAFSTVYELSIPNKYLEVVLPGLFSAVFEPHITEEAIIATRGIIANERKRSRWYPGSSEIGKYINTQWFFDEFYPLEQLYGSDEDLAAMSAEKFQVAHLNYFNPRIRMFAVGNGDISLLTLLLDSLSLTATDLPQSYHHTRWQRKEYHEQEFESTNRFELRYGIFMQTPPDPRTFRQLIFIGNYLTNDVHGPLYQWLRHELGWVYDLSSWFNSHEFGYNMGFRIPLGSPEQVATVRQEFFARMWEALDNRQEINAEVDRILDSRPYWHNSPAATIREASSSLAVYGKIVTVAEWLEYVESCREPSLVRNLFEQRFAENEVGSFCSLPKNG